MKCPYAATRTSDLVSESRWFLKRDFSAIERDARTSELRIFADQGKEEGREMSKEVNNSRVNRS